MNAEGKAAPEGGEDQQNENDDLRSPPHSARGTDTPLKSKSTTPNKSNPNERRDDANDNKEEGHSDDTNVFFSCNTGTFDWTVVTLQRIREPKRGGRRKGVRI
ncbi:hypothetical protein Tcan_01824 [Toxocara canis]|uniref:Uncharacterized protein n=1 Tax=Toxocara canis TaxID=6265 RepID=A0A0B2URK3_TOXCA|nr:hypothetical protein Tcan_01824 [Toxocara canis]